MGLLGVLSSFMSFFATTIFFFTEIPRLMSFLFIFWDIEPDIATTAYQPHTFGLMETCTYCLLFRDVHNWKVRGVEQRNTWITKKRERKV